MAATRCVSPFATWIDGALRVVAAGEILDTADPAYSGREEMFETLDQYLDTREAKRPTVRRKKPTSSAD
ncbi:hypothetical protein GCM10010472_04120 [Pseudonocardia halophobica]|uniref:Uncharacterized protein n=1 Tax=Pseudonocardia halophobica TaxID=29401 RepID=A0A9W6L7I1_9PSEU|nr:hypothetical protein [Pseudonocardia halophobica]GLL13371.1 hypothetical protein GCM10017577_45140 [Pseudonocardia halophobica]